MYRGEPFATKMADTASNVSSGVTNALSGKKTYPAPKIPNTPSETINNMLHDRCGHSFESPVKAGIAHYIAIVFTAITKIYEAIYKEDRPSHTMWMAACGAVAAVILLKVIIIYNILIGSAFIFHFVLYYAAIAMALFGIGLGVAGAVFFDKNSSRASTGFAEKTKTTVRETIVRTSQEFVKTD